jgi:hypothetical protein
LFRQFALAVVLVAVPVAGFAAFEIYTSPVPAAATNASLGDLTPMMTIITDVRHIAATGDLAAAERRITEFETAWDDGEAKMRPRNEYAWAVIDESADAAIHALRQATPTKADVIATLESLSTILSNPVPDSNAMLGVEQVSGIAVTDESGHPLACEDMISSLRILTTAGMLDAGKLASANDLLAKAVERCNADDDAQADAFSAQGLALANP